MKNDKDQNGGIVLRASAAATETGASTEVTVGKSAVDVLFQWAVTDIDGNNELYCLTVEGNTKDDESTWNVLGMWCLGATEVLASMGDAPATGKKMIGVKADHQIRVKHWISGAGVGAGITYSAKAFPKDTLESV